MAPPTASTPMISRANAPLSRVTQLELLRRFFFSRGAIRSPLASPCPRAICLNEAGKTRTQVRSAAEEITAATVPSSGHLAEDQRGVGAAEAEGIGERHVDLLFERHLRHEVDRRRDRGIVQVERGRRDVVA